MDKQAKVQNGRITRFASSFQSVPDLWIGKKAKLDSAYLLPSSSKGWYAREDPWGHCGFFGSHLPPREGNLLNQRIPEPRFLEKLET